MTRDEQRRLRQQASTHFLRAAAALSDPNLEEVVGDGGGAREREVACVAFALLEASRGLLALAESDVESLGAEGSSRALRFLRNVKDMKKGDSR